MSKKQNNQNAKELFDEERKVILDLSEDEQQDLSSDDGRSFQDAYIAWHDYLEGEGRGLKHETIYSWIKQGMLSIRTSVPPPGKPSGIEAMENYGPLGLEEFFQDYNVFIERRSLRELDEQTLEEGNECRFICRGDFFELSYEGKVIHIQNLDGTKYLHHLIANKGKTFTPAELYYHFKPQPEVEHQDNIFSKDEKNFYSIQPQTGSGEKNLDNIAVDQLRSRLRELNEDLDEAEKNNDMGQIERIQNERGIIQSELTKNYYSGKNKNPRRQNIASALVSVINIIQQSHPNLATHFKYSLSPLNGNVHKYVPNPDVNWQT